MARALLAEGEFIEVHVDTPLEVAESRDVKGLRGRPRDAGCATSRASTTALRSAGKPRVAAARRSLGGAEEAAEQVIGKLRGLGLIA